MSVNIHHPHAALTDLTITPAAQKQLKKQLAQQAASIGIRLSVKATGCSGSSYHLDFVKEAMTSEQAWKVDEDLILYFDPAHIPYLQELTIDFVKQGLNHKFVYLNPQAKGKCGCGESFQF